MKAFKGELVAALRSTFSQPVHFGELQTPKHDPYAGQYIRGGTGPSSADLSLIPLPDGVEGYPRYFVTGMSLRGTDREFGPNMGFLDFEGQMIEPGIIFYEREASGYDNGLAVTRLELDGRGGLLVEEENIAGQYGMGVTFNGAYVRGGSGE